MINRVVRAHGRAIALVLVGGQAVHVVPLLAQQPVAQPPPQLAPYRAPVIALVQPPGGGTVPQDKPVVVFRFAPGEPSDPLDVSSFRVVVDGVDQSARFQVAAAEAWGAIGDGRGSSGGASGLAAGSHHVTARVCSSRGACATTEQSVTVVPSRTAVDLSSGPGRASRRARVIELLLDGVKKILNP